MNGNVEYSLLEQAYRDVLRGSGFQSSLDHLKTKKHVLLICTSNRWSESKDVPKSTRLAQLYADRLGPDAKTTVIDASKLHIYDCEGNVSDAKEGNHCGLIGSKLKDSDKNPSGQHRCWASINHKDDELWKISKVLLDDVDAVVFFGSVRWGQTNAVYQRLIERLTWLENRHTTLKEENILSGIDAGVVFIGQNWNGDVVLKTQMNVLKFFGFNVPPKLSWNWQWTTDAKDESIEGYSQAAKDFDKIIASM